MESRKEERGTISNFDDQRWYSAWSIQISFYGLIENCGRKCTATMDKNSRTYLSKIYQLSIASRNRYYATTLRVLNWIYGVSWVFMPWSPRAIHGHYRPLSYSIRYDTDFAYSVCVVPLGFSFRSCGWRRLDRQESAIHRRATHIEGWK